jgi:hypothetical protein
VLCIAFPNTTLALVSPVQAERFAKIYLYIYIYIYIYLNYSYMLMSKINFLKIKKNYFNAFLTKSILKNNCYHVPKKNTHTHTYIYIYIYIYIIQWCVSINHFVVKVCDRNILSSVDCKNLQNCVSLTYEVTNANLILLSFYSKVYNWTFDPKCNPKL